MYLILHGTAVAERWDAVQNTYLVRGIGICEPPPAPPGLPRQPPNGLSYRGTGDAILLGHPRNHSLHEATS
jgi:hypothetical protein